MNLKPGLRSALARLAAALPLGARSAIARRLIGRQTVSYDDLLALAREYHVAEVAVSGEYGLIQSAVNDSSILGEYARTGVWSPELNALTQAFFSEAGHGTFLDVGANIGLTTIPVARNPHVQCIAIEPEPANYRNLVRNVELNCPHGNVRTHCVAAYSEDCTLELEIGVGNLGDHRIHVSDRPGQFSEERRATIRVEAKALDHLLGEIESPLAVKIDTQGAEPFVFAGAQQTIRKANLLIVEFWPYGMSRMGADAGTMVDVLANDFRVDEILKDGAPFLADAGTHDDRISALRRMTDMGGRDASLYVDVVAVQP